MFDYDQYVIGPLMIVGPWLLGGFLGWLWGRTWHGAAAAVGVGVILTVAGLAAFLVTAPPSAPEACGEDECVRIFGQWLEATLARVWPVYTAVTWSASALFFLWIRPANGRRFGKGVVASWTLGFFGASLLFLFFLIPFATR